mgnify:CR=1 FL=1
MLVAPQLARVIGENPSLPDFEGYDWPEIDPAMALHRARATTIVFRPRSWDLDDVRERTKPSVNISSAPARMSAGFSLQINALGEWPC